MKYLEAKKAAKGGQKKGAGPAENKAMTPPTTEPEATTADGEATVQETAPATSKPKPKGKKKK